jgi:hypothetical protein
MAYTHFRFIAYEVVTATHGRIIPPAKKRPVVSGFPAGPEPRGVTRIPVAMPNIAVPQSDDEIQENRGIIDARTRLKRLAVAVNGSAELLEGLPDSAGIAAPKVMDGPTILKVFVVPEFYFRPPATLGSRFAFNTYPDKLAMRIFKQLQEMFRNRTLEHWLIIAGTVLWNQNLGEKTPTIYLNTAVWIKGGPVGVKDEDKSGVIEKKLASGIDGVPMAFAPGENDQTRPIFESWDEQRRHIFAVTGTEIGLEVCLDHDDDDLLRTLKTVRIRAANEYLRFPQIGLHVLTAGGMTINEGSVAADVGGYILRNDGLAPSGPKSDLSWGPERTLQSEIRKVLHYDDEGYKKDEFPWFSESKSTKAELDLRVKPELIFPNPDAVPMGSDFSYFPEALVFYPRLPLPKRM